MKDFDYLKEKLTAVFREFGVRRAVLFGSCARGEMTEKSDVDIYVESGLRGLKFVGLIEAVREALDGRDVDLIDREHIDENSLIEKEIQKTGVMIYEG